MSFAQDNPTSPNPHNDYEVNPGPSDTVSQLAWSPRANFLVASSWDKQVLLWEVGNGTAAPKAAISHDAPALSCCWNEDGNMVFSGGCDKKVIGWDLGSQKHQQVGAHDAPVNMVAWYAAQKAVISGSWDKSLRYWDLRQSNPALKFDLPERLYAGDVRGQLGVFATADRKILIFDMSKPNTPFRTMDSPLKFQTRFIRCVPDGSAFAIGSIEGRVAMQAVDPKKSQQLNFIFKCHRVKTNIYPVNDLAFSKYGSFATVGGDGSMHIWCKEARSRLKQFKRANLPYTACAFNGDSTILAYAAGYDWQAGAGGYNQNEMKTRIFLKGVPDGDVRPGTKK